MKIFGALIIVPFLYQIINAAYQNNKTVIKPIYSINNKKIYQ